MIQSGPKMTQNGPQLPQMAQEWPKMARNYPQMAQKLRPDLSTFAQKFLTEKSGSANFFAFRMYHSKYLPHSANDAPDAPRAPKPHHSPGATPFSWNNAKEEMIYSASVKRRPSRDLTSSFAQYTKKITLKEGKIDSHSLHEVWRNWKMESGDLDFLAFSATTSHIWLDKYLGR